jgi:hypothetical protein
MTVQYQGGFILHKGRAGDTFYSTVSSTATFRKGCPVTFGLGRTLTEVESDTTAIVGIAMHDAADSLPGSYSGKCLVHKVLPNQTWVCKTATGLARSALSAGEALTLNKSGNYLVATSGGTRMVVVVPRDDGDTTVDSADSSIYVQFLQDVISPHASTASVNVFANQ